MSRSYSRNGSDKICGGSNGWARSSANRRLRRINKVKLNIEVDDFEPKTLREVSNVWCFPSDGLSQYYSGNTFNGKYFDVVSGLSEILNGGRPSYGLWSWARRYYPEGICEFFKLPQTEDSILSLTNGMISEYVNYLIKKERSR